MTRERRRFRSHAFHHAAVAANRINIIVEDLEGRPIVAVGKPFLGNGHADAHGDALPDRTGRGFDPRNPMVFRVTWGLAVQLGEATKVVHRPRGLPAPFLAARPLT